MSLSGTKLARQLYPTGDESAWDLESGGITFSGADYAPVDAGGNAVTCRGFMILGSTGTVVIDTPGAGAGSRKTIPSGLATGVLHAIAFTKVYSASTATTIVPFT